MIVLSHPTVNAFNRALAEALEAEEMLTAFHTTLTWGRRAVGVSRKKLRRQPWRELLRLGARRLGFRGLPGLLGVDGVYRALDAAVAGNLDGARAVYCYEDGAWRTFQAAKQRGLARIYELPIAYWETTRRLLLEEAARLPEWADTLQGLNDSPQKLSRKTEELALADLVICPSRFVLESLPGGVPGIVVPFGSPPPAPYFPERNVSGPLKVLFVGAMTQRKGLADLFAAFRLLDRLDIELVVMGSTVAPLSFYRSHCPNFTYEPPRSHARVLGLMDSCDILVLPSIVEGRALVQQEALSRGLPLLVTANAGAEELVTAGETGWVVPIRDPAALAERIVWFADHRSELPGMREAARQMAETQSWAAYTRRIIAAIRTVLKTQ